MDTQFLRAVLPENDGFFYAVRIEEPSPKGKSFPRHSAVKAATPSKAEWVLKHNADHGLFFTPFSYDTDYAPNDSGEPRNVRKLDRHKLTCQALWLDLDIGAGDNKYDGQAEALKAVLNCVGPAMPQPTFLVNSGGGIHAYWVLDKALPLPEWQDAAGRFRQYFVDAGLKFDQPITTDAARIMRIPGTDNMKTGTARPCVRLKHEGPLCSTEFIKLWPEATVSTVETNIKPFFAATDENLGQAQHTPKYTQEMVSQCEVFRRIAEDAGASCDEPLWKDVLQTVELTEDAEEYAHRLSQGHKDYSYEGTEAKRSERTHGKGILCTTFAAHFEDDPCANCPLKGKGLSPLSAGHVPQAVAAATNVLAGQPDDVTISNQGLFKRVPAKDGKGPDIWVKLSRSVITDVEALEQTFEGKDIPLLRVTHFSGPRARTRIVNLLRHARPSDLYQDMLQAGILVETGKHLELGNVFMSWYAKLQGAGQVTSYNPKQGWFREGHTVTGFAHGPYLYRTDGSVDDSGMVASSSDDLEFMPEGDVAAWTAVANHMLKHGNQGHAAMLATSFAAPLVELAGIEGLPGVLSFFCRGGSGKTTAMRCARAVWAIPDTNINSEASTTAALSYLHRQPSLPLYWDEPRTDKTREAVREFLFGITSGRGKVKANRSDPGIQPVERLRTIAVCASNQSMAADVSAKTGFAEGKRLLEIRMEKLPPSELARNDSPFRPLNKNHGVAAGPYLEYVVTNISKLEKALDATKAKAWEAIGKDSADRFYANTISVLVVGATVAKELGLVDFDVTKLYDYLVATVLNTREAVEETLEGQRASEEVLLFLRSKDVQGFQVATFPRPGGRPPEAIHPSPSVSAIWTRWQYLAAADTGLVRIDKVAFSEWYLKTHGARLNWPVWIAKAMDESLWPEGKVCQGRKSLREAHREFTGASSVTCFEVQIPQLATNPLKVHTEQVVPEVVEPPAG